MNCAKKTNNNGGTFLSPRIAQQKKLDHSQQSFKALKFKFMHERINTLIISGNRIDPQQSKGESWPSIACIIVHIISHACLTVCGWASEIPPVMLSEICLVAVLLNICSLFSNAPFHRCHNSRKIWKNKKFFLFFPCYRSLAVWLLALGSYTETLRYETNSIAKLLEDMYQIKACAS